jgi:hypothetical protein
MTKADGSMHTIEETATERDLGIHINNKLKWNDQVAKAKAKAYSVLSMLKRTFRDWDVRGFNILYTTFVRLHLEYCAQAWNPHMKQDKESLEAVQRHATKLVPSLRRLDYSLGITILEDDIYHSGTMILLRRLSPVVD